jgi:hypothetical protein
MDRMIRQLTRMDSFFVRRPPEKRGCLEGHSVRAQKSLSEDDRLILSGLNHEKWYFVAVSN